MIDLCDDIVDVLSMREPELRQLVARFWERAARQG